MISFVCKGFCFVISNIVPYLYSCLRKCSTLLRFIIWCLCCCGCCTSYCRTMPARGKSLRKFKSKTFGRRPRGSAKRKQQSKLANQATLDGHLEPNPVRDETCVEVSPEKKTGEVNGEGEPLKKRKSHVSSDTRYSLLFSSLAVTCGVSPVDCSRHGPLEHEEQIKCTTGKNSVDPDKVSVCIEDDTQMESTGTYKHTADSTKLSDSVHHSPSPTKSSQGTSPTESSRNSATTTCEIAEEHNELESMDQSTHADSQVRSPSSECNEAGLGRSPLHKKSETESPVCGLDSCAKLCGKNKKGTYFPYCSRDHRQLAAKRNKQHKPAHKKEPISDPNSNDDCFVEEYDSADVRQNDGSEGVPIVAEQTPTTPLSPVPKQSGATQQPSQREDATSKRSCEQLTCCGCPLLLTSEDRVNNEKFCIDCRAAQTTMVQDEEQLAISKSYVQTAKDFLGKLLHSNKEQKESQQSGGSERQGRMKKRKLDEQPTRRSSRAKKNQSILTTPTMKAKKSKTGRIEFYDKNKPYFELTNFFVASLELDGKYWSTTENYFQAQKYIGTPLYGAIQECSTAREAFTLSRSPQGSRWRRSDWEEVKQDVMYVALYAKFTQHQELKKLLVETGGRSLIEHTANDSYWGDGGDGSGRNHLGQLLMKLRKELSQEK